ncbi:acyltransferase family protein [Microbacterium oryzae]|uniref:Acyltransferase n=1 Tax=Microbacterium oryzae TaxID=743009 RepID=A0A6I6E0S8_9MICO|nr:acyltransferase family protein [Microbacterium oryzae]QGU26317.1 acyltransferase [Microbacterium oryzae]
MRGRSRPDLTRASGFRPDIQALRAIAVLSVLLYHLWPNRLPGGFAGVDVFFVISGYLITSHLVREREKTGRIGVARFWARRATRLLPASLLVLIATAIGTLVWVPRSLWEQFFAEIGASVLYVQNWRLLFDSVDYLAADNQPSPVQHFWTLSVEEQFYIALPLLLIVAMWALRRLPWRRVVVGVLVVATAASFAYGVWLTGWAASQAYFSTLTRAWEFGLGALLSFLPALSRRAVAQVVALLGVALIALSTVVLSGEVPFPGVAALLPVLGTALALWGGARSVLAPVGALAPVAFLGGVSYAVYLWHWPLVVLVPFVTGTPLTTVEKVGIAAVSLVLAWLSTRFIENPVRLSERLLARRRPRTVALWAAAGMACVLIVPVTGAAVLRVDEERAVTATQTLLETRPDCFGAEAIDPALVPCENPELDDYPLVPSPQDARSDDANRDACWSGPDETVLRVCSLGPKTGYDRHLLVIGDSHSNVFVGVYAQIAEERNWRIDVAGHGGCYWTDALIVRSTQASTDACTAWRGEVADYVAEADDVDAFVVTHSSDGRDADADVVSGMVSAWSARPDLDVPVIAILDNPRLPADTIQCIEDDPDTAAGRCGHPADVVMHDDGQVAAAERDPNATTIDMSEFYCADGTCPAVIGGVVVYRDGHHLTATYAATLAPYLSDRLAAALG